MFKIGDKVKCIDTGGYDFLVIGCIYTVKNLSDSCIYLDESTIDFAYHRDRFQMYKKFIDYLQIAKDVCGV